MGYSSISDDITQALLPHLNNAQMKQLISVLDRVFTNYDIRPRDTVAALSLGPTNPELMESFLSAKRLEGCSDNTLRYYKAVLSRMINTTDRHVTHMRTEDLRQYLSDYELHSRCSKANIDNIRRILSSFFSWLEDEDYILKSPIRRIKKIRSTRTVKDTYSDESLEKMRDGAKTLRDLAIIDLLASTGMRVGELVKLDIADVDFERRECVVLGKGNKERPVYFDARTKIHLRNYIASRTDSSPALFVSLCKPHRRLRISGVESRLRKLGKELGMDRVHPHKFRRTLATRAIDKGMPIEQVQRLLGHAKIDTTLTYAMVDQSNVRSSHRRYIA